MSFIDDSLSNKQEKYYKSEKRPENIYYDNSEIIKVVSKNFEEIVFE